MIGYNVKERRRGLVRRRDAGRVLHDAGRRPTATCSLPAGRPATRTTRNSRCPTFDAILKDDNDKDKTAPSPKQEAREDGQFKDLFDNNDTNKDGKISRERMGSVVEVRLRLDEPARSP